MAVDNATAAGRLDLLVIDALDALALYGDLRELVGRGEAACRGLAAATGVILPRTKKRFRRKAIELIRLGEILNSSLEFERPMFPVLHRSCG